MSGYISKRFGNAALMNFEGLLNTVGLNGLSTVSEEEIKKRRKNFVKNYIEMIIQEGEYSKFEYKKYDENGQLNIVTDFFPKDRDDDQCFSISFNKYELPKDEYKQQKKLFNNYPMNEFCICGSRIKFKNCCYKNRLTSVNQIWEWKRE